MDSANISDTLTIFHRQSQIMTASVSALNTKRLDTLNSGS
jgi:hypothetical protein